LRHLIAWSPGLKASLTACRSPGRERVRLVRFHAGSPLELCENPQQPGQLVWSDPELHSTTEVESRYCSGTLLSFFSLRSFSLNFAGSIT
jgi:hypothetical protein